MLSETKNVITIGVFDGIHLGHQVLLQATLDLAREQDGQAIVITFSPHPDALLAPLNDQSILLTECERKERLQAMGFDQVIVLTFNTKLAEMLPNAFIETYLAPLKPSAILIGSDFHFGKAGMGDGKLLETYFANQAEVYNIPLLRLRDQKIGSSMIKELIANGNVPTARRLLGWCYAISGRYHNGQIFLNADYAIPRSGKYWTWVKFEETFFHVRLAFEKGAIHVIKYHHLPKDGLDKPIKIYL